MRCPFRQTPHQDGGGSAGRCDVQLGRFCWWYDGEPPNLPPEAAQITRRAQVDLHELTPRSTSLEDVFLGLMGALS